MESTADEGPHNRPSKLPLLVLGAIVSIAVLVIVALLADRSAKTYPPGTPEARVQSFIQAAFDNDIAAVLSMLTAESRAFCETDEDRINDKIYTDDLRAELTEMDITADTARAEVSFHRTNSNDPFNDSTSTYGEHFNLILIEGTWQIDQASWPNQIDYCTRRRP